MKKIKSIISAITLALFFLITMLGWFATTTHAQEPTDDKELWRTLETPFEHVGQVLEDKEGNIWAVSWTGILISSDYTITNTNELLGQTSSTAQTKLGTIEYKTILGEGLAKFEQGHWITYTVESTQEKLPGDNIHAALFDKKGNLWLAVSANKYITKMVEITSEQKITPTIVTTSVQVDIGVVRFDGKAWQTFNITNTHGGVVDNAVRDIFEDKTGNLWFATLSGLSHYNGLTWTVVATPSVLGAEGILRVFQDSQNRLWVSLFDSKDNSFTSLGVARSNPITTTGIITSWQHFTKANGLGDDFVLSITEDDKGDIWFGTADGVSQFDGKTFTNTLTNTITTNTIRNYARQIWVATNSGAKRYADEKWQDFGESKSTLAIFKDNEGLMWFTRGDRNLYYYSGYHYKKTVFTSMGNDIKDLLESKDGSVWAALYGFGIFRYSASMEREFFNKRQGDLGSNNVWDLLETSDGAIWVGTVDNGGGVSRYYKGKWQTFDVTNSGLKSNNGRYLFESSDKAVWVATDDGGISRYQNGEWQTFNKENSQLGDNSIRYILQSQDGAIWVETAYGGVSRYKNNVWQPFNKESGDLITNTIGYLRESTDKAIWVKFIITGEGSRYLNGKWQYITDTTLVSKNTSDIQSPLVPNIRSLISSNGVKWEVNNNDLVYYHTNNRPPWIKLTTFNNAPLTTTSHILAYDDRSRISIGFEGNDLASQPKNMNYLFKLEGSLVYTDWQRTTSFNSIFFEKLDPGKYTLIVKVIDEDNLESEPAKLDITVEGPPMPPATINQEMTEAEKQQWRTLDNLPFFQNKSSFDFFPQEITGLTEDKANNIWLTFNKSKLVNDADTTIAAKLDAGKWVTYTVENLKVSLPTSSTVGLYSPYFDRQSNFWAIMKLRTSIETSNNAWNIKTEPYGIVQFDGKEWQTFTVSNTHNGLMSDDIDKIFEDTHGNLWFANSEGISSYDGKKWQVATKFDTLNMPQLFAGKEVIKPYISSLFLDNQDKLWLTIHSAPETVIIYSDPIKTTEMITGWQVLTRTNGGWPTPFAIDKNNNVWFGTGKTLNKFDGTKWETISIDWPNLSLKPFYKIFVDSEEQVWLVSFEGIARYINNKWEFISTNKDFFMGFPLNIFQDSEGLIWFIEDRNLRYYTGYNRKTFNKTNKALGSNTVKDLLEAKDGTLWVGTEGGGVSRYQNGQWQIFNKENRSLGDDEVEDVLESSDGIIWVGTRKGGISSYENGKWQIFNATNSGLVDNYCWYLLEANDKTIWAGTDKGGISHYVNGKWQTFTLKNSNLGGNSVRYILQASDGAIWAEIQDGGASRYQDGQWQQFTKEKGDLKSNTIGYLREGSDKAIWLKFINEPEQSYARYQEGHWQYLTFEDVLTLNVKLESPFVPRIKSLKDKQGLEWKSTEQGLEGPFFRKRSPWIDLTTFNGNPIESNSVHLAYHDTNRIRISFEGNDLITPPDKLIYLYKLNATDWQTATYNNLIELKEIPVTLWYPNTLWAKTIDEDGNESELIKLEITTAPIAPETLGGGVVLVLIGLIIFTGYQIKAFWYQRRDIKQNFNPYISERSVTEPTMFFGRQEILNDIRTNIQATNFVIYGPKRIGKTSLLHQLDHYLSQAEGAQFDYVPVIVSLHAVPEERFFKDLIRKIVTRLLQKGRYPQEKVFLPTDHEYDNISFTNDLVTLKSILEPQSKLPLQLILLIDEGDALMSYSQGILAQLRELFMTWAGDYLKIVLTCENPDERDWELYGSPWMSIFGKQYHLTPFTPEEARELIVKPVPNYHYEPAAIERILERSQLVPRHIQNICRQTVAEMLLDKTGIITLTHVETALPKVQNLPLETITEENNHDQQTLPL